MPKTNKKAVQSITEALQVHRQSSLIGRVVAAKIPQTVTVVVERKKMHLLYHKAFTRTKKYLVQDEMKAAVGDLVEIVKIRPISKNKHFKVAKILGRDIAAVVSEELKENAAEEIAQVLPEERTKETVMEESQVSKQPQTEVKKTARKKGAK